MDYKTKRILNNTTEPFPMGNISEYRKVFHLLDELGFTNLKEQFSEHQIQDSTLAYMESEEELKVLLKEIGLPAGPVFAFVKLWFRCKDNPDNLQLDKKLVIHNKPIGKLNHAADDKYTQTDNVNTSEVSTQTKHLVGPTQLYDPYDMYRSYPSLAYQLTPTMARMPFSGNLASRGASAYGPPSWSYTTLPNVYPESNNYNTTDSGSFSGIGGLMNGLDKNSLDPLENFSPHDSDESSVIPLEKNGNEISAESESLQKAANEYALFPNTEPLCSPKTSHMNLVNEKDDAMISRFLQAEQEREQKSYATALKDHKEGQNSLPNSTNSDLISSPSAGRSRSSSTTSATNLSRSASSTDFHPLSPTRETHETPIKSPPNRPYVGIDDIDPQQKSTINKSKNISNLVNPTFSDFFDNLQETPEYIEATKEKNVKAGWRPHSGKHEKSGRRLELKPQYIDKEGRVRHGIRVRGALKSMECWLHTNSKPPIDCLFAHSRIGDTLEFICIRCTYEKPRNYECRDKKSHAAFVCNVGPYRALNGEKWRGKVEPS